MYAIGNSELAFIQIRKYSIFDEKDGIEEVVHSVYPWEFSRYGRPSMFYQFEEAKCYLDEIKCRKNEIRFKNSSVLDSIINGNDLDVESLKIYEFVPLEVDEEGKIIDKKKVKC